MDWIEMRVFIANKKAIGQKQKQAAELFEIAKQTMYDYIEMNYEDPEKRTYKLVKLQPHFREKSGGHGGRRNHLCGGY